MSPAAIPRAGDRGSTRHVNCLCILLAEEGSADLPDETVGAELLSSVLLTLEAQRNRVPLARELLPG